MTNNKTLSTALGCISFSVAASMILNFIIFPLGFIFFHDCGKWICTHEYPMTLGAWMLIFSIVLIFSSLAVIAYSIDDADDWDHYKKTTQLPNQRNN